MLTIGACGFFNSKLVAWNNKCLILECSVYNFFTLLLYFLLHFFTLTSASKSTLTLQLFPSYNTLIKSMALAFHSKPWLQINKTLNLNIVYVKTITHHWVLNLVRGKPLITEYHIWGIPCQVYARFDGPDSELNDFWYIGSPIDWHNKNAKKNFFDPPKFF